MINLFYQNNHIIEIRRARLRELSDDRLNQETNGFHDSFGGGSFERSLKDLEKQGSLDAFMLKKMKQSLFQI